jgi:nucleotide-binding universal stress UspA family protein
LDSGRKCPAPKAEIGSVSKLANQLDLERATAHVKEHPAEGFLQAARSRECDLIVMVSNGRRGLLRLMLGSQAVHVLTHTAVPVLFCK